MVIYREYLRRGICEAYNLRESEDPTKSREHLRASEKCTRLRFHRGFNRKMGLCETLKTKSFSQHHLLFVRRKVLQTWPATRHCCASRDDCLLIACTRKTNVIIWFGHGCTGDRMHLEHESYCGLGMDALAIKCLSVLSGEGPQTMKKDAKMCNRQAI